MTSPATQEKEGNEFRDIRSLKNSLCGKIGESSESLGFLVRPPGDQYRKIEISLSSAIFERKASAIFARNN
jgi:hypothetical protein